jgi:hypothetical protein
VTPSVGTVMFCVAPCISPPRVRHQALSVETNQTRIVANETAHEHGGGQFVEFLGLKRLDLP